MAVMSAESLRAACRRHSQYQTPALNDILYASNQAYSSLGTGLGHYINLKSLFLDGNALISLEQLPSLQQLSCL